MQQYFSHFLLRAQLSYDRTTPSPCWSGGAWSSWSSWSSLIMVNGHLHYQPTYHRTNYPIILLVRRCMRSTSIGFLIQVCFCHHHPHHPHSILYHHKIINILTLCNNNNNSNNKTITVIPIIEGSLESTTAEIVTPVITASAIEITNKEVSSQIITNHQ